MKEKDSTNIRVMRVDVDRIRSDCKDEYYKHNPQAVGLYLTDAFIVGRMIKHYLGEL